MRAFCNKEDSRPDQHEYTLKPRSTLLSCSFPIPRILVVQYRDPGFDPYYARGFLKALSGTMI